MATSASSSTVCLNMRTKSALALLLTISSLLSSTFAAPATTTTTTAPTYSLVANYEGAAFFDAFDNFVTNATVSDPTNGFVNYVDLPDAISQRLVGVVYNASSDAPLPYIGVQHTADAPNSVRLESKNTFTVGTILVADIHHLPVGCGLWPAFWALGTGAAWPGSGEIDLVEYVHDDAFDHITLHTGPGCSVDAHPSHFQGNLSSTNCNAKGGSAGCSVSAHTHITTNSTPDHSSLATAGQPFNAQGGAVYVLSWTTTGIAVYLFPRAGVPADLTANRPEPTTWTAQPLARFAGAGCDFATQFTEMRIILNTDFCGSWAGTDEVWSGSGCRAKTGVASCEEYVRGSSDEAWTEAYWLFGGVKLYSDGTGMAGFKGVEQKRDVVVDEGRGLPVIDLLNR